MDRNLKTKPTLKSYWPKVAEELEQGLRAKGKNDLAAEVENLRIEAVCPCEERFCQSIYVSPPIKEIIDLKDKQTLELPQMQVDIVLGEIYLLELLYRDELIDSFEELLSLVGSAPTDN